MKKMAAIGLCMHKILRIIYGMLKNNQAYDFQGQDGGLICHRVSWRWLFLCRFYS